MLETIEEMLETERARTKALTKDILALSKENKAYMYSNIELVSQCKAKSKAIEKLLILCEEKNVSDASVDIALADEIETNEPDETGFIGVAGGIA